MSDFDIWDCIVVGLGGHGSSIISNLANSGVKVLGIERFSPVHSLGSSHGNSRIIRTAYFEDPRYVPLLQRSMELWKDLQLKKDYPILKLTGGLMIGKPSSDVIKGTLASVTEHNLPHQVLTHNQIKEKFKVFEVSSEDIGVYETNAG